MADPFTVTGCRASTGRQYVRIEQGEHCVVVPLSTFHLGNRDLLKELALAGLTIIDKEQLEALNAEVKNLNLFHEVNLLEHIGWNDKFYAMSDGSAFSAENHRPPLAAYHFDTRRRQTNGELAKWKKEVAEAATRHSMLNIVMAAMFLPPLLRFMPNVGNVIIELIGNSGTGKSTAQRLAASVVGDPGGHGHRGYGVQLDDLLNRFDDVVPAHADHPLIIDGVAGALINATKTKRGAIYKLVAHDLTECNQRLVVVISGQDSLKVACSVSSHSNRVIRLAVQDDAPHGIFDSLPKNCPDGATLAERLLSAAGSNHGFAYRRFIEKLVNSFESAPDRLIARLDKWQGQFMEQAAANGSDGDQHRAARTFAAIYAAGKLAFSFGAVPRKSRRLRQVLEAYHHHRRATMPRQPFAQRLESLITKGEIVGIDKNAEQSVQIAAVEAAIGTVAANSTRRIVKIRREKIDLAFPDWLEIQGSDEVRALLKVDGRNLRPKGSLAPGMVSERLFQFRLPLVVRPSLFDDG